MEIDEDKIDSTVLALLFLTLHDERRVLLQSEMKSSKNPYASKLKKPVTIRLSEDVIDYFKIMAEEEGVPYQSLVNLYLRDCAKKHRKININWQKRP